MNKLKITYKWIWGICIIFIASCSVFFQVDPQIAQVKKIGFLTVYINNNFYNRKNFKEDFDLEIMGFSDQEIPILKQNQENPPLELVEYFLNKFYSYAQDAELNKKGIILVPVTDYVNTQVYQQPINPQNKKLNTFEFDESFHIEKNYFTAPANLKLLPFNKIIKRFKTKDNQKIIISSSVSYDEIGNFAQKLGFDGLLVVEVDSGYEKLEFLQGSKIKPIVTLRLLLIDKHGQAVLNVGQVIKNERKIYTGEVVVANIKNNKIDFTTSNNQDLIASYKIAINNALDDLYENVIEKAWP